jgi:hypothetical protein
MAASSTSLLCWEHRVWKHGLEGLYFCYSGAHRYPFLSLGEQCPPSPVSPRRCLSWNRPSHAIYLPPLFRNQTWMVYWEEKSSWSCWSPEVTGLGRYEAMLISLGHALLLLVVLSVVVVFWQALVWSLYCGSLLSATCSRLMLEILLSIKVRYDLAYS